MIRLFLFIVLLFSISACTKSAKPTSIVGRVLTYGTDEVIDHPPVLVQLYRQDHAGCWGCGYNYEVIDEVWSDEEGAFQLQGNLYEDESYFIGVDGETVKESRHYISPGYGHKGLEAYRVKTKGGIVPMDYSITALGWVRFHFDISGLQPTDLFSYSVGGGGFESFAGNVQTERLWDFGGNFEHRIALEMRINGEWTNWQEYFFVPAFDTIDYEIKY
jgi:hypothetical protein